MKITVKQLQGGECIIEVAPSTTISEIKSKVATALKIPVPQQKLILLGRNLVDDQPVQAYRLIKDGTKLNLVVKKPEGLYEAAVKNFKKSGLTEAEANAAAQRLLKIVQEKFNKLSWDDIERLSSDCIMYKRGKKYLAATENKNGVRNVK